ncbi:methylmalonyl-CoA/ethylmalonyl-CoA epimerase [Halogranum amylolyticum]|uniref:Methylmalonyl-CoA/ethylmalonyl-CoA epimerase n=1 Tax=Halogranum amylolyticum TaxID=660520 RepID=A0A1H8W7V9_9EURY|nr:VOC family protein [Halogranum amylolyticum]SEP23689.1 methylmalonyl-CoA/ethylmalonyl-CoA epimerase [Halogranum amylolyticum]
MSTHDTPIRVDHVGIAVESVPEAEAVLSVLGAVKRHEEPSPDGSFTWGTYELGGASRLELVSPREGGEESFLTDFLAEHGPGVHHVTLEVADLGAVVEALEAADVRVVDVTERDDWTEAFVSPRNPTGVLFQLMEYHEGYAARHGGPAAAYVGGVPLEGER